MRTSVSFAARAFLALAFLLGFYGLALGLAGVLLYLPYLEVVHLHRISIRLTIAALAAAFAIVRALFMVRSAAFHAPGPEIRQDEQPELFALIRDIATRMNTRMPAHVYVIPDVNAFVAEVSGFMGFGTTRVMGIGLGLLAVDDVSELKATIAHEFGHFTGGDTVLGGLVYRTRAAIGQVLTTLGTGFLTRPFEWYAKVYLRVSFAVSRHQELQADRAGIAIAGRAAHVDGLRAESRAGVLFGVFVNQEVGPLCEAGVCPRALHQGFTSFVRRIPQADVDAALDARETDPHDTHPALPARIAFAESVPDPGVPRDTRPALSLLRRPDEVEASLEPYIFGALGVKGALRRIAWDEVTTAFYAPRMAEEARLFAERLFPVLGAGPSYRDVFRAFAAAVASKKRADLARTLEPRVAELPAEVQGQAIPSVLRRALGVMAGAALLERGGVWKTEVGAPLTIVLDGETLEPNKLAGKALDEPAALQALLAMACPSP
jgi:Zn-dependent protease with chaperone function